MKTNPNEPINPDPNPDTPFFNSPSIGLTKREYFAAMALIGVLSGRHSGLNTSQGEWAANAAVEIANNLITELNKGK